VHLISSTANSNTCLQKSSTESSTITRESTSENFHNSVLKYFKITIKTITIKLLIKKKLGDITNYLKPILQPQKQKNTILIHPNHNIHQDRKKHNPKNNRTKNPT
jgi:hypothetical protein